MGDIKEREILTKLLARVRRTLLLNTVAAWFIRSAIAALALAAVGVAIDQRLTEGRFSLGIVLAAVIGSLLLALCMGFRGLGVRVRSALTFDEEAQLNDRVSSAWEFLSEPTLTEAHHVQIRDAIRHAESLDCGKVLRFQWPRFAGALPIVVLLLTLSFFVPPPARAKVSAAADAIKAEQIKLIEELKQELAAKQDLPEEIQDVLKKLEEVRKQYEKGEIGERDLMLQLGRLDESLKSKVAELGVENLENELNAMVPHLSASMATVDAAQAIKEKQLDKAAEALKNLAEKSEKLTNEEKKQLAAHLGAAAAKLGKKSSSDSFSGNLSQASEAITSSDKEGLKSACQGMSDKLGMLKKCQGLKSACNKIGLCKSSLGQCENQQLGYNLGPKSFNQKKGGLKAGTSTAGDPLADPTRLADSYKKMLQISGQAGQGPTETETEVTSGQMSQGKLSAKELHASYAAAAEEVIEKEDVPLSHRYHVKRYFQAIRPKE